MGTPVCRSLSVSFEFADPTFPFALVRNPNPRQVQTDAWPVITKSPFIDVRRVALIIPIRLSPIPYHRLTRHHFLTPELAQTNTEPTQLDLDRQETEERPDTSSPRPQPHVQSQRSALPR